MNTSHKPSVYVWERKGKGCLWTWLYGATFYGTSRFFQAFPCNKCLFFGIVSEITAGRWCQGGVFHTSSQLFKQHSAPRKVQLITAGEWIEVLKRPFEELGSQVWCGGTSGWHKQQWQNWKYNPEPVSVRADLPLSSKQLPSWENNTPGEWHRREKPSSLIWWVHSTYLWNVSSVLSLNICAEQNSWSTKCLVNNQPRASSQGCRHLARCRYSTTVC